MPGDKWKLVHHVRVSIGETTSLKTYFLNKERFWQYSPSDKPCLSSLTELLGVKSWQRFY